ncbi:MAG: hypothetical protein LUG50_16715 [Planctomycetaceae bacterium]|nr:hypothetical protein [Planctomycetaceae bacterium]
MADEQNRSGTETGRRRLAALMAGCFILGLGAMYLIGALSGRHRAGPDENAAGTVVTTPVPVRDEDVARFLEAVKAEDYDAMRDVGGRTFRKGVVVADHAEWFGDYATTSHPPYAVYAFYVELAETRGRRVMLTVDADGVVDSFMAEEMKIVE